MKNFHLSDVLTVTTGRLVSSRHMEGVYEILNFLTGDNLYTHQLPRAMDEAKPWLRVQFPQLMMDNHEILALLNGLDDEIANKEGDRGSIIADWVKKVSTRTNVPMTVPVYEMGADMHTHIDPIEEAAAMFGDDRVVRVDGA